MTTAAESEALIARYGADTVTAALAPLLTDQRRARIDSVLDARLASLTIVLENLYDPHNGAAALRSVEGIGLDTVHVVEGTGPFAAASTVTIGCDKWLALRSHRSAAEAARALRAEGMVLCAAVPDVGTTIDDVQGEQPLALWFGNEHDGLTTEAIELCDHRIEIPMHGFTRSFNLSVSVALLTSRAAELRRRSLGKLGDLPDRERANRRAKWYAQDFRGADQILARFVSAQTRS